MPYLCMLIGFCKPTENKIKKQKYMNKTRNNPLPWLITIIALIPRATQTRLWYHNGELVYLKFNFALYLAAHNLRIHIRKWQ